MIKLIRWLLPFTARSGRSVELAVFTDQIHCGRPASTPVEAYVVIILCHGKERDASGILQQLPAHLRGRTGIVAIAPHFVNGLDKHEQGERLLVWKGNEWGEGGTSRKPDGSQVSSFEAIDAIVRHYRTASRIIVVGHSLGAQLVQRYSILGAGKAVLGGGDRHSVRLDYVVMNPSTFVFFNDRPYKYGLHDRQAVIPAVYTAAHASPTDLVQRLGRRRVHYLNGARDDGVGDDRHEAIRQGRNRHDRASAWQAHLKELNLYDPERVHVVPSAGHDAGQMMGSHVFLAIVDL